MHRLTSLTHFLGFGFCSLSSAWCLHWCSWVSSFLCCNLSIWSSSSWIWSTFLSSHISLVSLLHSAIFSSSVSSFQVFQLISSKLLCLITLFPFNLSVGRVGFMTNLIMVPLLQAGGSASITTSSESLSMASIVLNVFARLISLNLTYFWGCTSVVSSAAVRLFPLKLC